MSILERRDIPREDKERIKDVLFKTEQLLLVNNNIESTKLYDSVKSEISSCSRQQSPLPSLFGEYTEIVSSGLPIVSFTSSVIFGILGLKKGKN